MNQTGYIWFAEPAAGGEVLGQILVEHGVKYIFGIHGGSTWGLQSGVCGHGVKIIHMRHEQAGAYAADGYGRCKREVGVCLASAGPGLTNAVSGIAQAYFAHNPLICLTVRPHPTWDTRGPLQPSYGTEICKPIAKWTELVSDVRAIPFWVNKAFADARAYPPGPIVVEFTREAMAWVKGDGSTPNYIPRDQLAAPTRTACPAEVVEQAVDLLLKAERPAVVAGPGVYWSDASQELREFVELLQLPVNTRRIARGAVPEDHPLAFSGGHRKSLLSDADLIMAVGLRIDFLEGHGQPPLWNKDATYIQLNESREEITLEIPTGLALVGDPKVALRQLIECARATMRHPPQRGPWLEKLRQVKESHHKRLVADVGEVRRSRPIHPHALTQEIVNFLDDSATIVFDSFTGTYFLTDKITCHFAGKIMDSGIFAGVGHGVGTSIGAQMARPGKQVFAMMGDAGIGVSGADVETALRYNLPIVFLVYNNSSWISHFRELFLPEVDSWDMLPDLRYDKMFEAIGCHGEHVERPEEIRPALERAFNSGKTAVINVIVDRRFFNPLVMQGPQRRYTDPREVPTEEGRRMLFPDWKGS